MSIRSTLLAATIIATAGAAHAAGELNIYNWGNYTSPELIKKFEEAYDVKVSITDFDSNTTALTKIEAGGHGFDIVVPTHSYMQIYIDKGLLMESGIPEMENFKNMSQRWKDVDWDPGRKYSVPWQWGSTGVAVNTSVYSGDPTPPPFSLIRRRNWSARSMSCRKCSMSSISRSIMSAANPAPATRQS